MKNALDLIKIAGTGVNLVVDAKKYTTNEIINIVGVVGLKGKHITITYVKNNIDLIQITTVYPNNITFDFTEK